MMMKTDSSALARWRLARRICLGTIVVAGTMATASAVAHRLAEHPCGASAHASARGYETFSGVGAVLVQDGNDIVVTQVLRGAPADGVLFPGAVLLSVDGERPDDVRQSASMIRGEQGTSVELKVMYPCSGPQTVEIERALLRVRR